MPAIIFSKLQENNGIEVEKLIATYQELAEEGLAPAQLRLMRLYADNGNDQEAVKWALKAAEQQNPQAQYFLAQHYQYSSSPDLEYSHKLYQQSAAQGFIAAHWQTRPSITNWGKVLHKTLKSHRTFAYCRRLRHCSGANFSWRTLSRIKSC